MSFGLFRKFERLLVFWLIKDQWGVGKGRIGAVGRQGFQLKPLYLTHQPCLLTTVACAVLGQG